MHLLTRSAERQQRITSLGMRVFKDALKGGAQELAAHNDIIVLGVKPIYMPPILKALKPFIEDRHLIVSIAAGLKVRSVAVTGTSEYVGDARLQAGSQCKLNLLSATARLVDCCQ